LEDVVVVAYPDPIPLEAKPIRHSAAPDGSVALAYFFFGRMIARGVVPPEAVAPIQALLRTPVSLALAAEADDRGNIDGRICLVLPVDPTELLRLRQDEPEEPWRASVGDAPTFDSDPDAWKNSPREEPPRLALFPIGYAVRGVRDRRHPDDVAADAREMLENLLAGKGRDSVSKAIDDLLSSL
jgi:hypothetical protein